MNVGHFFEWFQFGALVCWGLLGVTRALVFRMRGVSVLGLDRQRSAGELAVDGIAGLCLLLWSWEVVAHAWRLSLHFGPASLQEVVVDHMILRIAGATMGCAALIVYAIGLKHLGDAWRLGIDREHPGPLVTEGIYRISRHPIYLAFDLLFVGAFLTIGRPVFLVLALVWLPVLHGIILREERFLSGIYGAAYRDYCRRTGRYLSWSRTGR